MNKIFCLLLISFLLSNAAGAQVRKEYTLEKGWRFSKGDAAGASGTAFDDSRWEAVRVPHDWAIYGPFDVANDRQITKIVQNGETKETPHTGRTGALPYMGVGWYRTQITVPEFKKGRKVTLLFDGAMSNARIYVNGKKAGYWPYGYSSFHFDITPFLNESGANTLAVRLENKESQSRWYPGAGLYRNVHLIVTSETAIDNWGTYVTTPVVGQDAALVRIATRLTGATEGTRLITNILDEKDNIVQTTTSGSVFQQIVHQELEVKGPKLWSPETPALYTAVSKLYRGDVLLDEYRTRFGIREIKLIPQKGFSLNGTIRKLKGVCNHHDLGPLGAAVNVAALKRQLRILKDMGCDAIRTSHNPPAPELLTLCDEMGFMVMDEAFDEWKSPKVSNGYHLYFDEWAEKDMVNMLHRDRNHPSIVMWSIGNEIGEQGIAEGNKVAKFLMDICHREDPTRPVGAGMDRIDGALNNNFAAILDVPGFNYKPARYAEAQRRLPQGLILGSETASTISSRGVYKFPLAFYKNKQYPDGQCSSYDFEACFWSQVPDDEFVKQDSLQYVMGEFVWTGFDYLGEPTPYDEQWPSRSSYFGIIDLAGLPKDRYYLYRSRWNADSVTLHILPHWTWPGREGEITPVFCYTSYPEAELFINGKSMGRQKKHTENNQTLYRLMWKEVKYEPGVIKVVAYDGNGKAVATDEVRTAGKPHHIELAADRNQLSADGKDLAYITAQVVDAKGNLCPDATNLLQFKVTGEGVYRAACNGDATSLEIFHQPQMKAFSGMVVATVQATEKSGAMQLQVSSNGLKAAVIKITTQ